MNLFFAILGFINAATGILFGSIVYFRNRNRKINRIFFLLSCSILIWGAGYGMWQLSTSQGGALFWSKILSLGSIFIPILILHWVLILLNLENKKKGILLIGYLVTFSIVLLLPTDFVVRSMKEISIFPFWPQAGPGFYIFTFFSYCGLGGYSMYLLLNNFLKATGYRKEQIRYVLLATILGLGGGATNLPQWYGISLIPYGTILVPIYPFILAYAMTRYRLMDIRFVLTRGVIFLLSFLAVYSVIFLLIFLIYLLKLSLPWPLFMVLILASGIFLFQIFFSGIEKLASKHFYYSFYSYQRVLSELSRKLTQILNLEKLSDLITKTLLESMKLEKTVILLRNPDGSYKIQKNIGFREENGISLVKDNFLTLWLENTKRPLVYEELSMMIRDAHSEEIKEKLKTLQSAMKRIEAALCLPLFIKEKIIGLIVLGNKISGDPYSEQDIDLLTNLANQASIAIQNAKLYSEVKGFSEKLEKEVEKRTKELKEAYEELKKLDQAKSEFISIASHQLRTPLTAIKGYISMLLEGTYGDLTKKIERPLENIYTSNERLIRLVNDILNVSRIETGRINLELKKSSLEEIVKSIVKELEETAREKGIYLKYEKPKKSLPKILIDRDKIRQVILNVIDNAIRYTNQGGVTIKIQNLKSKIRIIVKDTGEGMTKDELAKLFKSFSRGVAGTKLYTEGVGLGLYIARRFIELHEGKIWAESKGLGKGSTFYIELPKKL